MEHKIFLFSTGEFLCKDPNPFYDTQSGYTFFVTDDPGSARHIDEKRDRYLLQHLNGKVVTLRWEVIDHE